MPRGKKKAAPVEDHFIQEQGSTWKAFEKTTPYACEQRRKPFDVEACRQAWEQYVAVYVKYGYQVPLTPAYLEVAGT